MNKKVPLRNIELWPPRPGQFNHSLAAHDLMDESLKKSGTLPRLVGRISPTKRGMHQVPFGALFIERATKLFGPDYELSLELGDFSNDDMFRMFNLENNEAWHNLPISYLEVVHAAKAADERGELQIPRNRVVLTGPDIARYLGGDWTSPHGTTRMQWCMQGLDLIESGDLKTADLRGLNSFQAKELIAELTRRKKERERDAEFAERQAREAKQAAEQAADEPTREAKKRQADFHEKKAVEHRTRAKTEAKKIIDDVGSQCRTYKLAAADVRRKAEEVGPSYKLPKKAPPWLFQAANELHTQLSHILAPDSKQAQEIREIIRCREQLDEFSHELLVGSLTDLAERANQLARALGQPQSRPTADANPRKLTT